MQQSIQFAAAPICCNYISIFEPLLTRVEDPCGAPPLSVGPSPLGCLSSVAIKTEAVDTLVVTVIQGILTNLGDPACCDSSVCFGVCVLVATFQQLPFAL